MRKSQGLSPEVIPVIQTLRQIIQRMDSDGDTYNMLTNYVVIAKAYESGQLKRHPGLVTYWSGRVRLCETRRYDWNELDQLRDESEDGGKRLCVETVSFRFG
jgi:hypothetical protein